MGMSASQVRFLSLQHRKHDVGRQLTALSNRKQALSRDMNEVSKHYTEALNKNVLKWSNDSGMTYNNLSYDLMMKPNELNTEIPYIVSTRDGKVVVDSVANLIGKVDDEYVELTGKTFSSKAGVSGEINYANIAKWITSATNQEGLTGNLYVTTDGFNAGTKNVNSYVIPSNALDYGFENTLRYQIFEELGLVNQTTTDEYNELLRKKYGSEGAKKNGNYGNLLQEYIKADPSGGRILKTVADQVTDGSSSVDAMHSVTLAQINGIDLDPKEYSAYFGRVDNSGVWNDEGCLEGNLALAEYAVTEYDKWCADLKELNLSSSTTLNFTATSGRSKSWEIAPVLQMNGTSNANTKDTWTTQTKNYDGTTITTFDTSWFNNGNAGPNTDGDGLPGLLNTTWEAIFDDHDGKDSTIVFNNDGQTTLATVSNFVAGLMDKMSDTSKEAVSTISDGTTWTFENVLGGENLVQDTDSNGTPISSYLDVMQAAQKFALAKTLVYYTNLDYKANHESGCDGGGPSPFVSHSFSEYEESYNHTEVASDVKNGWGHAEEDHCGWHSFTRVLGGIFEVIGSMILAENPLILLTEAIFTNFNWIGDLADDGFSNIDPTSGDGTYALDMNNVMQTYLTFMEMYLAAYDEKGANMLTGEGLDGTYTNVNNNNYRPYVSSFGSSQVQFGSSATSVPSGITPHPVTDTDGTVYQNFITMTDDGVTTFVGENYAKYTSGPLKDVVFAKRYSYAGKTIIGLLSDFQDVTTQTGAKYAASIFASTSSEGWMVVNHSSSAVSAKYNVASGSHAGNNNHTYNVGSTYYFNTPKTVKSTAYDATLGKVVTTDVEFNKMWVEDNADHTTHYYMVTYDASGNEIVTEQTVNKCKYDMEAKYDKTKGTTEHLEVKAGATSFGKTIHAYVTQDMAFKQELLQDVQNCRDAIDAHNLKMQNFFSNREQKLMDYYDAIFLRIAEQGWVEDDSISGTSNSLVYLNNKLQNNDYFVTVCQAKVKGGGYNYTNKQAVNVMKIFQVRDEDAENVALATYEAEKSAIAVKERAVDARMQKLETEQEVINTELESIKKVKQDNIDRFFKIFA